MSEFQQFISSPLGIGMCAASALAIAISFRKVKGAMDALVAAVNALLKSR